MNRSLYAELIKVSEDSWGKVNPAIQKLEDRAARRIIANPALAILESSELSQRTITPVQVAKALNDAGISFVIIGAHAVGVHTGQPRATKDVDVVVDDVPRAVQVLRKLDPKSKVKTLGKTIGTRITDQHGKELVDVLHPTGGVRGMVFGQKKTFSVDDVDITVPTASMMLAMKYMSMFSPVRTLDKRRQDLADFSRIYEKNKKIPLEPIAKMLQKTSPLLAKQFLFDMAEEAKGNPIQLY
jgi:hypothetical protein